MPSTNISQRRVPKLDNKNGWYSTANRNEDEHNLDEPKKLNYGKDALTPEA